MGLLLSFISFPFFIEIKFVPVVRIIIDSHTYIGGCEICIAFLMNGTVLLDYNGLFIVYLLKYNFFLDYS